MMYLRSIYKSFLCFVLTTIVATPVWAEERIILSVINGSDTTKYSLKQLDNFTQHTIETATPWTARHKYSGPLLKDVLLRSGPYKDKNVKAYALNNYIVEINQDLLDDYSVILATHKDGKAMRIRDKGPIWIMLPLDQYPELDNRSTHGQMVWQLNKLESR